LSRELTRDAPGRVNLIGEHTDYNEGFVLPIATPQRTVVTLAPRGDSRARVHSSDIDGAEADQMFIVGDERRTGGWIDYVQGVTSAMRARGWTVRGFDGRIRSDVPLGAGLSSSAALEIAVVRALAAAFDLAIDEIEVARIGHVAETRFVGAPVGIMDQMAASLATADEALFLDTRSLQFERVAIPRTVELVVIDSGITHRHAAGAYRTRRAECDEAARLLGVRALRDVTAADLDRQSLPEPLQRRARHVISENDRVLTVRDALKRGDVEAVGAMMNASHQSMRDDFEVSTPEIDELVAIARAHSDVVGARLTGGGFGGAIVALAVRGRGTAAAQQIAAAYAAGVQHTPAVLIPRE
jgi:galactokinase